METEKIETTEVKKIVPKKTPKKTAKSIADVMQAIADAPSPIVTRRAPVITAIDLEKIDLKKFKHDYPSSNSGMIALLLSRPTTRHELLGFLVAVYYGGKPENVKRASSRLNGFLANRTPRKGIDTVLADGKYSCKA